MVAMIASVVTCIVGCNTGSPDSQALHVLEIDPETGAAKIVQSVTGLQGTTYFAIDAARKSLYSAIGEKRDAGSVGTIVKFALEGGRLGPMTRLAELPCEAPCHVALTPDGSRVSFASYLSGTAGTVGVDGKGLKTFVLPNDAMGPNRKRQQKAYAHQTFFVPADAAHPVRMGVVDLGCDRIWFFDPVTMARLPSPSLALGPGDGPRHALFLPGGKSLQVVNELSSTVASFAFDGEAFTPLGRASTLPDGFARWEPDGETLATKAAAIKATRDGRIVMASNRGHDSIAFFEADASGRLVRRNVAKLNGRFPRDFELLPNERFMVVGHKTSDEIQVYAFDRAACTLTPVGKPLAAWRPLCFKFL